MLDVGCGAGVDTLLAAQAVGLHGRVIGLDMTPAMVERTRRHAAEAGLDNVEVRDGLMVARDPKRGYHFHTGPEYAAERLGYSAQALAELPDSVTAPFAGVGNPLAMGEPKPGETGVDIGAGSGMDSFLAARAVGPTGRVIAVDTTDAMLERGRESAALRATPWVEYCKGLAEALPVADGSADLVISNGVINLVLDKDRVLREALRPSAEHPGHNPQRQ